MLTTVVVELMVTVVCCCDWGVVTVISLPFMALIVPKTKSHW